MSEERINPAPDSKAEESLDLAGLLLEYLGNWKWFLLSIVICLGVAYYHICTIIPIYQVSASIYLSGDNSTSIANAVSMSDAALVESKQFIDETEIEILKSRNNMMKVVDTLDLAYSYCSVGKLRDVPIYGTSPIIARLDSISLKNLSSPIEILCNKNDEDYKFKITSDYNGAPDNRVVVAEKLPCKIELSQGTLELHPSPIVSKLDYQLKIKILPPAAVAARLAGSLDIQFAPNSMTILRISFRTPVTREGIDVINTLISLYNADIIEDKNRSAMQTEAFILDRLVMISGELKDVESRLEEYRRANNIVNLDAQAGMNLSKKNESDARVADVALQQELISSVEKAVARQDNYTTIAAIVDNPELSAQIDAYNKKVSQRERLLQSSTEDNPTVLRMQEDLDRQKSILLQGIRSAKSNLNARRSSIAAQGGQAAGQLANLPPIDKGLQEIFREQQVKVNIYTFLLQKREEIALQKTLATPTARLIDNPSRGAMVSPKVGQIMGIAFLIGFLIPAVLIYMRRRIFPVFKDKEDLENATKVPVIAEICKISNPDAIVVNAHDTSPAAELFRLLRNNVQFILHGDRKVILVTSSLSGEGKTFIASNIAMSFAITGRRTLVIGMDIRRPVLAHQFKLSNRQGITTYLSGQTNDWRTLIHPSGINENLYVMPAGPVPPNPNELLLSDRLDTLINELRDNYDYIVIDSAPIGLVSDSMLVARVSDIQLYVTRANYSTRRCLKMMHDKINDGRFPHAYLILNGVDINTNAYRYRRYGSYGVYGSSGSRGYGYGYKTETPLPSSRIKKLWRKAMRRK